MGEFFEKDVFVVLSKSKEQVDKILEQVETAGGLSARNITKKVTLVVCEDIEGFPKECQDAEKLSIPLVLPNYVSECVTKGKRLDLDPSFQPVTKKAKVETPAPPTVDSSSLDIETEWTGTASSEDFNPFILKISTRNANEFTGIMEWPTLDNVKQNIKGEVDNAANVKWEAFEIVEEKGKDTSSLEVPVSYEGKLEKSTIVSGSFTGKSSKGKFKMSVTKRKDLAFIKTGAEFKGVFKMAYPFNMLVQNAGDAKSDGCFGGTIVWPSIGSGNETEFKGVKTGDTVTWQEHLIKKGSDVEVPVNYEGKLENNKVTGKCEGSSVSIFELTPA